MCPCGYVVKRRLGSKFIDNHSIVDFVASSAMIITGGFAQHWFVVLEDGTTLTHGGDSDLAEHFTASKSYIYLGKRGNCPAFTACMKREWPQEDKYNLAHHNCQTAVRNTIKKCLEEQ